MASNGRPERADLLARGGPGQTHRACYSAGRPKLDRAVTPVSSQSSPPRQTPDNAARSGSGHELHHPLLGARSNEVPSGLHGLEHTPYCAPCGRPRTPCDHAGRTAHQRRIEVTLGIRSVQLRERLWVWRGMSSRLVRDAHDADDDRAGSFDHGVARSPERVVRCLQ